MFLIPDVNMVPEEPGTVLVLGTMIPSVGGSAQWCLSRKIGSEVNLPTHTARACPTTLLGQRLELEFPSEKVVTDLAFWI